MLRQVYQESVTDDDPLVGAWSEESRTKKCPDCAETILADAKVCKHCGYRFTLQVDGKDESPRPKPPTMTRALRSGDRVKLTASGDKNEGKTGTVIDVLDDGSVLVRFGGLRQALWEHWYRPNQLKPLDFDVADIVDAKCQHCGAEQDVSGRQRSFTCWRCKRTTEV